MYTFSDLIRYNALEAKLDFHLIDNIQNRYCSKQIKLQHRMKCHCHLGYNKEKHVFVMYRQHKSNLSKYAFCSIQGDSSTLRDLTFAVTFNLYILAVEFLKGKFATFHACLWHSFQSSTVSLVLDACVCQLNSWAKMIFVYQKKAYNIQCSKM